MAWIHRQIFVIVVDDMDLVDDMDKKMLLFSVHIVHIVHSVHVVHFFYQFGSESRMYLLRF